MSTKTMANAPPKLIDPDEEALRGIVRAIGHNCLLRETTGRDELQAVVNLYREKYPRVTVDLVRGAMFVLEDRTPMPRGRHPIDGGEEMEAEDGVDGGRKRKRQSGEAATTTRDDPDEGQEGPKRKKKQTCKHEGCDKWAQRLGLCISHGGIKQRTKRVCAEESCHESAIGQGRCRLHGGTVPTCARPGCHGRVVRDGRCAIHKQKSKLPCQVAGCPNHRKRGGFCWAHGANDRRCQREGCPNQARREGVCGRHYCATHGIACKQGGCDLGAARAEALSKSEEDGNDSQEVPPLV